MTDVVEKTPEEIAAQAALEAEEGAKGLQAGFEKVRGKPTDPDSTQANADDMTTTQTAEETAAKKAEEEAAAKAAAEAAEKAWLESAPASVRQSLEIVGKLPDRLRNIEGHIGGLKSALQTATEAAKAAKASGGEAPTQAQIDAAAGSGELWKQMKEDFPDWADAMEERLAALGKGIDVDGLKKEVTQTVKTETREAVQATREFAKIDRTFKDWDWEGAINTPEYEAWFAAQPEEVRALSGSTKAEDAIRLLGSYQAHEKTARTAQEKEQDAAAKAAALTEKTKRRLEAAIAPKGSGSPPAPPNRDANAFRVGWNRARGLKA